MKEGLKIICGSLFVIVFAFILFSNFSGIPGGIGANCKSNTLIWDNYVTGLGYQFTCDRSNNTKKESRVVNNSERSEREKEIDKIATDACLEQGGVPKISSWDGDVVCKFKK